MFSHTHTRANLKIDKNRFPRSQSFSDIEPARESVRPMMMSGASKKKRQRTNEIMKMSKKKEAQDSELFRRVLEPSHPREKVVVD